MIFDDLRVKYNEFVYEDFKFNIENENLVIEYSFAITGLESFNPKWVIPLKGIAIDLEDSNLKALIFSLGLAELISYWKITCSPNVIIKAGVLNKEQISWWKKLCYNGLGEFFYMNNIETNMEEFMNVNIDCSNQFEISDSKNLSGNLIPIGGGKDSIVTLDLMKEFYSESDCFIISARDSNEETVIQGGYHPDKAIIVKRTLDPRMLDLNTKGFLNGHTPYSSIVAFSSLLVAYICNKKYIVLSNESSANESTVLDTNINHQYSKSFEFEMDFKNYLDEYLNIGIEYFSLLRGISEFQITKYFSKLTEFHNIFKSCNQGSKENIWCSVCPKCLFVFIMLTAFLDIDYISEIFGANMLENPDLVETLYKLIGEIPEKPFECVGSRDEVNVAICIAIDNMDELPYLYREYKNTKFYDEYKDKKDMYLKYYDKENLIPEKFIRVLEDNFNLR